VAPGSAFGPEDDAASDAHVRICFAPDPKLLAEGLRRLGGAVSSL
jgi:aspartate/methionine/tyrosine aminotransferase